MRLTLIGLIALVSGCVTTPITLPDGTQGYAVECRNNMAVCAKRASKLCPTGYDIVNDDRIEFANQHNNGSHAQTNVTQLIRCKTAAAH